MSTVSTMQNSLDRILAPLMEEVKKRESEQRFCHTLSVAKEVLALSELFSLSQKDTERLYTAALLHDITKALTAGEQKKLAETLGVLLSEEDLASGPILHSLTGAALAQSEFSDYTDPEICEAIRVHTTGKPDMTLFDKLLFLADYIEETRQHPVCQKTRKDFYRSMATAEDKEALLDRFIVDISQSTVAHLEAQGKPIHSMTLKTIDSLSRKTKAKKG